MYQTTNSEVRHLINGDIGVNGGQLGQTVQADMPASGIILHTPGTDFDKYYHNYIINLDTSTPDICFFDLAEIGNFDNTKIMEGHTFNIVCLASSQVKVLNIRRNATIIGQIENGHTAFMIADSAPDGWQLRYALPFGLFNRLVVYSDPDAYPKVTILPLQKEFFANANFEYGIKCLVSTDYDEIAGPAMTDLSGTNLNRIIVEGCTNTNTTNIADVGPNSSFFMAASADMNINFSEGLENVGIVACNNSDIVDAQNLTNSFFTATTDSPNLVNSQVVDSIANSIYSLGSNNVSFTSIGTLNATPETSRSGFISCADCTISGTESSNIISSFGCTMTGNGNPNSSNTKYLTTILSSFNLNLPVGDDYSLRVVGGNGSPNWQINSNNGEFTGSTFTIAGLIPGFAEYYENLNAEVLPEGRILTLDKGRVRLAQPGDESRFVSRAKGASSFVAGDSPFEWLGKYERDDFGSYIYEELTSEQYAKMKNVSVEELKTMPPNIKVRKISKEYNPELKNVPRSQRPKEWTLCEMHGKVILSHDGTLSAAGQYVAVGSNGVGILSSEKTNIVVLSVTNNRLAVVDLVPYFHVAKSQLETGKLIKVNDTTYNSKIVKTKSGSYSIKGTIYCKCTDVYLQSTSGNKYDLISLNARVAKKDVTRIMEKLDLVTDDYYLVVKHDNEQDLQEQVIYSMEFSY